MREIPKKNYLILAIVLLVTVGLLYYFYLWYSAYSENSIKTSIMDKYIQVINYNELDNYILENSKVYVYASILNDTNTRKYELEFKNSLVKNNLTKDILYLDLTNEISPKKILKYSLEKTKLPCILVFESGELTDKYDIKSSGYSSDKTIAFLISQDIFE